MVKRSLVVATVSGIQRSITVCTSLPKQGVDVTDPNVKAAVANALQGVGALVNQLQGLRFSIQVNQA